MIVESDPKKTYEAAIPIHGYTILKRGLSRVSVGIRNLSCQKVTIPAKSIIAKVSAANVVPHSFAPNLENNAQLCQEFEKYQQNSKLETKIIPSDDVKVTSTSAKLRPEKEKLLFSKIDLTGIKD